MKHERNFQIKKLPVDFKDWEKCILKEWIISGDILLRFRLYDDNRCYMDMKRDIHEFGIKCEFNDIKYIVDGLPYVEKDRYKQRMDNYLFTIDIFNNGDMIFEIESKDKDIVDGFIPFEWLGEEVL